MILRKSLAWIVIIAAIFVLIGCFGNETSEDSEDVVTLEDLGIVEGRPAVVEFGYAPLEHPLIGSWRLIGVLTISNGDFISVEDGEYYVLLPGGEGFVGFSADDIRPISWGLELDVLTTAWVDEPWEAWRKYYSILGNRLTFTFNGLGPPCQNPRVFERVED